MTVKRDCQMEFDSDEGKKKNASTGMVEVFLVVAGRGFEPLTFGL